MNKQQVEDDDVNIIFQEDNIPLDFQDLDKTLRCVICTSLFDKAVTIKDCGHTYCSVCIRNHWVTSRNGVHRQVKKCPTCRQEVSQDVDKALVMNRNIQEGGKDFPTNVIENTQIIITETRNQRFAIIVIIVVIMSKKETTNCSSTEVIE